MLKYYLTFYWRSFKNNWLLSFINLTSLALGLSACIIIFLFIKNELNQDHFHPKHEQIYLLGQKYNSEKDFNEYSPHAKYNKSLFDTIPEIIEYTRVVHLVDEYRIGFNRKIGVDGYAVTPNFFKIFNFPIIKIDSTLMQGKQYIFISEDLAENLYTDENPLGQLVTLYHRNITEFVIAGVVKNAPSNSSLKFDFIVNYDAVKTWGKMAQDFFLFDKNLNYSDLNKRIDNLTKYSHFYNSESMQSRLFAFSDIYFNSNFDDFPHGNKQQIITLVVVCFLLLFTVLFNYFNLSISQSLTRLRSIGINRVIGLNNKGLFWQFQLESLISFGLIFFISSIFLLVINPYISAATSNKINIFNEFSTFYFIIPGLLCLFILLALILYRYFQSGAPIDMLKKQYHDHSNSISTKNNLVLIQFVIATIVIIATGVIYKQTKFMMNQDYGYHQENIVKIKFVGMLNWENRDALLRKIDYVISELDKNANIIAFGPGDFPTDARLTNWNMTPEKTVKCTSINYLSMSPDFPDIFDLKIIEGKTFDQYKSPEVIINRKAVDYYNLENPIGHTTKNSNWGEYSIVGVVENFHYKHLSQPIEPLIIINHTFRNKGISIRIAKGKLKETMAYLKKLFKRVNTNEVFAYEFFDQRVASLYQSDIVMTKILQWSTIFILFLCCVGLFSLSIVYSLQKTKEIGIRKILGATTANLLILLGSKMTSRVVLAFVIASPLAWWIMQQWLETFAYSIILEWWYFALSGLVILILALFVISYNSLKTARANPVDSLRSE